MMGLVTGSSKLFAWPGTSACRIALSNYIVRIITDPNPVNIH